MAKRRPANGAPLDETVPAVPGDLNLPDDDFDEAAESGEHHESAPLTSADSPMIAPQSNPNPRLEPPADPIEKPAPPDPPKPDVKQTAITLPPKATIKTVGDVKTLDLGDAPAPTPEPQPFVPPEGTTPWYCDVTGNPTPVQYPVAVVWAKDVPSALVEFGRISGVNQFAKAPIVVQATKEQADKYGPQTRQ